MKYGLLFAAVAGLLVAAAVMHRGWYFLCLWPAVAFAGVSVAYFTANARLYGKRSDGRLAVAHVVVLWPVFLTLTIVFHLARVFTREPATQSLTKTILIGRRLMSHELPDEVDAVIDLTSEFSEPAKLRSRGYHSFPMLDADVPNESDVDRWLRQTDEIRGTLYVHCAQGHGRTALFASLLLLHRGLAHSPEDALQIIQAKRPGARLNSVQLKYLNRVGRDLINRKVST